ncbi:MAG: zinc ribbon domain-containing protein [Bdellovibrionales bacterium]|nr:zinc ribbon domain-containing protein [Bdellovibrionales bacterium]
MIYEYKCEDCGKVHEVWAKMSDPAPTECPFCKSAKLEKVISATSFSLKGTGWYTTDYKKSGSSSESNK